MYEIIIIIINKIVLELKLCNCGKFAGAMITSMFKATLIYKSLLCMQMTFKNGLFGLYLSAFLSQDCKRSFPSALCLGGSLEATRCLLNGRGKDYFVFM